MAHESSRGTKATPDRGETSQQAAIRERISAAESDVSQAVRDGFRAGATASEVMQTVIAASAAQAGDDAWTRSFRGRLRMHGLNEIVRYSATEFGRIHAQFDLIPVNSASVSRVNFRSLLRRMNKPQTAGSAPSIATRCSTRHRVANRSLEGIAPRAEAVLDTVRVPVEPTQ